MVINILSNRSEWTFYFLSSVQFNFTISEKEVISVLKKYFKSYDYEVDVFIGKESLQEKNTITSEWLIWPEMEDSGVFIRKK